MSPGARIAGVLLAACALACVGPPPPAGHISGHPVPTDAPGPVGRKVAITRVTVRTGRPSMGALLQLTLVMGDEARAGRAAEVLFRRADEYENLFNARLGRSALNRLSDAAGRGPQPVDPRLARILGEAIVFARETHGAFDVTAAPLADVWSDALVSDRVPSEAELDSALVRVGSAGIKIHSQVPTVDLTRPGMRIDLGGMLKGWTLDRLGEVLAEGRVHDALLDYGPTAMLALGRPADADAWRVAVHDGRSIIGYAALRDMGFAESGSAERSAASGLAFPPLIDPRTGQRPDQDVQAAVVAPDAATAQVWSTALRVLGPDGLALVEGQDGVEAQMVLDDGSLRATSGWAQAVSWEPSR